MSCQVGEMSSGLARGYVQAILAYQSSGVGLRRYTNPRPLDEAN